MAIRGVIADSVGGQVVAFYPTRAEAEEDRYSWAGNRPDIRFEVIDGGSRWAVKGGRWLVVLMAEEVAS